MRGLIKGVAALFIVSLLLSILHSCSLDSSYLNPDCMVSEMDLDEKWWYPKEPTSPSLYFRYSGKLMIEGVTDSLEFQLLNCNKIVVTNYTEHTEEHWLIKRITDVDLHLLFPDGALVMYGRKK
jgi:hypothetical protein